MKTPNGPHWLTVPIENGATHKKIHSVRIINKIEHGDRWFERHLRTLQANYSRAPYFEEYFEIFKTIYRREWEFLADCNIEFLKEIFKILEINVPIQKSSQLKLESSRNERIVEICKIMDADTYVTGRGGLNYIDKEMFHRNGINLILHDYKHPTYTQRFERLGFLPNMSIIDLIFNHGPGSMEIIKSTNTELIPLVLEKVH